MTPVSCPKNVVPSCPCCNEDLIKKCGTTMQWHFAHQAKSSCSGGGGDSFKHKAAKLIIAEYFNLFRFTRKCRSLKHSRARKSSPGYIAHQEYRVPGTKMTVNVAILTKQGVLKGIVEIFHTHATSDDSMENRERFAPCFEVRADDVIKAQKLIPLCEVSGEKIDLACVNPYETNECTWSCKFGPRKLEHRRRPCSGCKKWGVRYVPIAPQPKSYWKKSFTCEQCCVACAECEQPCPRTFSRCGRCETQARLEKMQQERTGQEKEKQERTRLEKEKQERKKAEGLPEWARGRPDAVCIL